MKTKSISTMLLAATAILGPSIGSAYAGDGEGPAGGYVYPGSVYAGTQTLVQNAPSVATAQNGQAQPRSVMATQVAFHGSQGSMAGQSVITSRGPAFVTGNVGSLATTTLPGSAGQGFLMSNGNGTSTLLVPGGVPQTVATPR
jgi:hypothetical protein